TDAYYANKPFVLFLDSLDKYLVGRVKDARTILYKEIDTLSQMVEPTYVDDRDNGVESLIYEIPELHAVLDWDVPTRGFKIMENTYKIVSGEKVYIKEETFLCMATLPGEMADADIVRQIVHAKWGGVENNAIKDLKDNWYMEHNFHYVRQKWFFRAFRDPLFYGRSVKTNLRSRKRRNIQYSQASSVLPAQYHCSFLNCHFHEKRGRIHIILANIFHHHPNAAYALLLILFMAHNLFYSYVFRHLKSYGLYQPTMKRIREDFMSSFLHWKWRMSWVNFDGT
ncbi:hypothetical protein ACFL6S_22860, partial [Candidatus Poribacteria bacterium]